MPFSPCKQEMSAFISTKLYLWLYEGPMLQEAIGKLLHENGVPAIVSPPLGSSKSVSMPPLPSTS
jgi:hypothetical protein